jgi:hypothetical protein
MGFPMGVGADLLDTGLRASTGADLPDTDLLAPTDGSLPDDAAVDLSARSHPPLKQAPPPSRTNMLVGDGPPSLPALGPFPGSPLPVVLAAH